MSSGAPFQPASSSDPNAAWDDLAILQESRADVLALIESLEAQRRDLGSRDRKGEANYQRVSNTILNAIQAMRGSLHELDEALSKARESADNSRVGMPPSGPDETSKR